MKKILSSIIVLTIMFFGSITFGQEWHTVNQITVSWGAVTEMEGGIPIPEEDIIEYRVYIADVDKIDLTAMGITGDLFYTITLQDEGQYFVGLQTIRKIRVGSDNVTKESIISWTDDPAICLDGNTFGIRYFLPPEVPTGVSSGI